MENSNKQDWSETIQLTSSKKNKSLDIYPLFSRLRIYIEDFDSVLSSINPESFFEKLSNDFMGLMLDFERTTKDLILTDDKISLSSLLQAAANDKINLFFHNGKIKFSKDNIESIAIVPLVLISSDFIEVTVNGDAHLAEEAVKRISTFMFDQASIKRSWPEIKRIIYAEDWTVSVEVDMKLSTTDFLHPALKELFLSDQSPLKSYGSVFYDKNSNPIVHDKKIYIEPKYEIRISVLDSVSGVIEKSFITITREKTFQRGTTTISITGNCNIKTLEETLTQMANVLK